MKSKKSSFLKRIFRYSFVFLFLAALLSGLFFLLVYFGAFGSLPDEEELAAITNEEASLVFSSDNRLIGKYFAENRTNISWEEVPVHLRNALIATEDKRFYTHKGYDTQSYLRVFLKTILLGDNSGGGGSTLTQQLIKNLYGRSNYGFLSIPVNKLKEIIIASRMETVYDKEELLLLYFNSVPFGEDVYGVESASRRYFDKSTRELLIEESAVLVGMLKANTYFNPRLNPKNSLQRRNVVLSLMEKEAYLSSEEAAHLKSLALKINYENVGLKAPAGYFVYQVKKKSLEILEQIRFETGQEYSLEKDGLRIYTTLDLQVQELAAKSIKKHMAAMQPILDKELEIYQFKKQWFEKQNQNAKVQSKRKIEVFDWKGIQTKNMTSIDSLWHYYKMLNASVLITNPKNGNVISWIGGNNYGYLPFDMVLSHRQIASAFKPILYASALEKGYSASTYLENEEKIYPEYDNWKPQNYNHRSSPDSTVSLWYALANSMNLPTVDLYFKLGREDMLNTCNKLYFPRIAKDAPSIALGTLDLSLAEIVRAYAAFANQGKLNELVMIDKITDASGNILFRQESNSAEKVFSIETSQEITAILEKAIDEGTGVKIRTRYGIQADLAGKTGTAQNYSNAWFLAYTPDMVIGTWVGARTPDLHFYSGNGSGSSLALPVAAGVIKGIERDTKLCKKYLTPFAFSNEAYSSLQSDPYKQKGIDGFFNRLFKAKDKEENDTLELDKAQKKTRGVKSFFRKLFKGKRDK